jgi:acyl-CoA reductase-like NAD-dependent aldehyde dehydrogenase
MWAVGQLTGSDRVGKIIAMEAAKHLKPCVFELGGKAPSVVGDAAVNCFSVILIFDVQCAGSCRR